MSGLGSWACLPCRIDHPGVPYDHRVVSEIAPTTVGTLSMTGEEREALDTFGSNVVAEVYDRACAVLQGTISHGMTGSAPDPMYRDYRSLDDRSADILRRYVILAIDQTFAHFLYFLDEHQIPLVVRTESGQEIDVRQISDGLAAEPYNEEGWIARFSAFKERLEPTG